MLYKVILDALKTGIFDCCQIYLIKRFYDFKWTKNTKENRSDVQTNNKNLSWWKLVTEPIVRVIYARIAVDNTLANIPLPTSNKRKTSLREAINLDDLECLKLLITKRWIVYSKVQFTIEFKNTKIAGFPLEGPQRTKYWMPKILLLSKIF